ncbi:hypothetical protein O181_063392 [Austropuccinia psidii MF-1]|uniref:Reverse transcriptase Ty1/copia-type domain-containing protein n=1 Tax=Austropuccinia psidii MF-1 TaxID=1389203 RepID=A0A9Q3I1B5_9BASI|nr:hypothetical protein [Austropuccinia psidii MF-1]
MHPEAKSSKQYKWIPENQPPPKKILGKVGDPRNIIQHSRQTHDANAVLLLKHNVPKTYSQAINSNYQQEWQNSIATELENMKKHNVWSPSETIENVKPLSTTWLFKRKTDKDGNLTKFEERLCVRGFSQKEGIDYRDAFSPTGRLTPLQLLLTLCHLHKFKVEQMDVRCTFLNGKPEKELYILRPKGYTENQLASMFKLNQSLYGLKQSPWCWHKELRKSLMETGLSPTETDPCLYHSKDPDKKMWLFIHVDKLIFGGSWNTEFKQKITTYFDMEDLGCIKYALGIQITQENE